MANTNGNGTSAVAQSAQPDVLDSAISSALGAQSPQSQPTSGAAPQPDVLDTAIASALGKPVPASGNTQQQPDLTSRILQGVKDSMLGRIVGSAITPPQSSDEQVVHAVGGAPSLQVYRAAKSIVDSAKGMMKSASSDYGQAVSDFNRAMQDFHNQDWRNLASSATSTAADVLGATQPVMNTQAQNVRELSEGARPGGNLATPLTRDVIDAGTAAAAPSVVEGAETAADGANSAISGALDKDKSLYQQVRQGADIAQTPTKAALRNAAQTSVEDAGIADQSLPQTHGQPIRTLLDEPIATLADTERAAYDTINKASGTDLKALYDHAEEVQDALDDPTNIANRAALQNDLTTTQDAIASGENQAVKNGVNPDLLDKAQGMTQQRYAMQTLKQKLFNNESVVKGNTAYGSPEAIDVDSAIRQAENLNKPSKFAPEGSPTRLQQALGEDGANRLLQDFYSAQKAGQKAVRAQQLAKFVVGAVGGGALFHAGEAIAGVREAAINASKRRVRRQQSPCR